MLDDYGKEGIAVKVKIFNLHYQSYNELSMSSGIVENDIECTINNPVRVEHH